MNLCIIITVQIFKPLEKGSGNYTFQEQVKGLEILDRPLLFNLDTDMGELTDISDQHAEVVKELLVEADKIRLELGDVAKIIKEYLHLKIFR